MTYFVIVPPGSLARIGDYWVFEAREEDILKVKPRPIMPGISDIRECRDFFELSELAAGRVDYNTLHARHGKV
jgi:hypothetical protein